MSNNDNFFTIVGDASANLSILQRKRRNYVLNLAEALEFNTGDIVVVVY
jgi:hypothetical protein